MIARIALALLLSSSVATAAPPVVRVAPASEPGPPMVLGVRVVRADGAPAEGVRVTVYHTDARGEYGAAPGREHRLEAVAVTDADGRFEVRSIRPAPYPGGRIPAHVHFVVALPDGGTRMYEVRFADDPTLRGAARARRRAADPFDDVQPVRIGRDGVHRLAYHIRLP